MNLVIKLFKKCPVDYLFKSLQHILQGWFHKNRTTANGTFTRLAEKQEKILRQNAKMSLKLKVSIVNTGMHRIRTYSCDWRVCLYMDFSVSISHFYYLTYMFLEGKT